MSFIESTFSEPEQTYIFQPKEDITVYELAQLLPILIGLWRNSPISDIFEHRKIPSPEVGNVESLPDSLKRHFIKINNRPPT